MIKLLLFLSFTIMITACGHDTTSTPLLTIPDKNDTNASAGIFQQPIPYHDSANIPLLTSGYGSFGRHEVSVKNIPNSSYPAYASRNLKTTLFYPADLNASRPTLFFYAGAEVNDVNTYKGLFYFVASKGYNIIFITYPNYELRALPTATQDALDAFSAHIDRNKVGFMGHSMGAGVAFWIINQFSNLGSEGRLLFPMASGYSAFNVSNMIPTDKNITLPPNTKMFLQMYAKDGSTDIRIGIDLFLNNTIPNIDKDFIFVYGDDNHIADHGSMAGGSFDGLRQRTIFRPLDALMDEAFNHNTQARGTLKSQSAQDIYFHPYIGKTPQVDIKPYILPEASYPFNCSEAQAGHYISKRKEYCKALGL